MLKLKLRSIKFGKPNSYHFVTFHSGENNTNMIENRIDVHVEVRIPSFVESDHIEEMALNKAQTFIKQLADSL